MRAVPDVPVVPPPEWRFRRKLHPAALFHELWDARTLVWTLAEREIRIRYKQAILGFAWAVVTPLVLMVAFTLFRKATKIDTGPVPYPLFAFIALIPWTFFSTSVAQGGLSLINNVPLLNKVYCPREVFPAASLVVAGIDSLVSTVVLGLLFLRYGFMPKPTSVWVPVILPVQLMFTLGITLMVSAVIVYLRDLRHALPLILQMGLFVNPLAAVIDGYRRAVLYGRPPSLSLLAVAAVSSVVVLTGGYAAFKRLETGIADVA
jgi:ABC-type polysaccharide/polyol phosphate export permease